MSKSGSYAILDTLGKVSPPAWLTWTYLSDMHHWQDNVQVVTSPIELAKSTKNNVELEGSIEQHRSQDL